MRPPELVAARTVHVRDAEGLRRRFGYGVDLVLVDAEATRTAPLARNRRGLVSLWDRDHGGGPDGIRALLRRAGLEGATGGRLMLLAQPRMWGRSFNPVAFWLAHDREGGLRAVVAEVTNTYGDRHRYLCHRQDHGPIGARDDLEARKVLHVSPFLPNEAIYRFRFDISPRSVAIRIEHQGPHGRLIASLAGPRRRLTRRAVIAAALRRPGGAWRVSGLIHWQALRLWRAGGRFRPRPRDMGLPPDIG